MTGTVDRINLFVNGDQRLSHGSFSGPVSTTQEVQKRFPDGVPLLDPIDDMGIKDPGLKKVIQKVEAFEHRMYSHPMHSDPSLEAVYSLCERKALVRMGGVVVFGMVGSCPVGPLCPVYCHMFCQ